MDEHGRNAVTHAARKADGLREAGDADGCRLWLQILEVIRESQSTAGRTGPNSGLREE